MSLPEEIRQATEWVGRYLEVVRDLPVMSSVGPGDVESALPEQPPKTPELFDSILADLDSIIVPGTTHWNHPRFFGYFANSSVPPAIAGELISAAMNSNAMLWRTSPAATELEAVVCRWLAGFCGLPNWFGVINDTASTSTLYALIAAREAAAPETRIRGLFGATPLAVYCSDQAHSSVDKAVLALGLGTEALRKIPSDPDFRMDVDALEKAVEADLDNGLRPAAVVATIGTTAATAVDPLRQIIEVCRNHGIWVHVDAAYAGVAAALEEFRWIFDGVEEADSLVTNPHKWLFVPIDCSVSFLREPGRIVQAFSVVPEYLETTEEVTNLMDFGISLGRRFRALKLWMVFRAMGTERMKAVISEHIRLAKMLAGWVEEEPEFEIVAPVHFSVVNFRYSPKGRDEDHLDELNAAIVRRVNEGGEAFLTTVRIGKVLAIHAAIGNFWTSEDDVAALWDLVKHFSK